jgi:hypothetical protein
LLLQNKRTIGQATAAFAPAEQKDYRSADLQKDLARVRNGTLAATEFLRENTSGKLSEDDLTDEGNRFTEWFYRSQYGRLLLEGTGASAYLRTEAETDFSRLKETLDGVFKAWQEFPAKKPWWKLW